MAAGYAQVVDHPSEADLAVLRLQAPHDPRGGGFEQLFRQSRLHYTDPEIGHVAAIADAVPTVVDVFLERPATLTGLAGHAQLVGDFGATDRAVLDAVLDGNGGGATLPVELPRTPEQVDNGGEDVPRDAGDPLFAYGHGHPTPESGTAAP
ncbi:hypothetical protein ACFXOM_25605 [Streptomyces sp. NPDC059169]|uniref:hypothetical protein n=1 Tax=Streptomyces sp. NPDC059169 TaxID=3346754 RepID=UPI0036A0594F